MVKIVIDTLGSDNTIEEIVKGIHQASLIDSNLHLICFGPKEKIEEELKKYSDHHENIEVMEASDVILANENPVLALRTKKEASMVKAFEYLKNNKDVEGMVTCGSTASLIVGSIFNLNTIKIEGIQCVPCLSCLLPSKNGNLYCLLDCGANIDCTDRNLVSFAYLGNAFMKSVMEIKEPRIGLLSNGKEEGKGNNITKEVYKELKNSKLNFVGNIEGTSVNEDLADVLVADGFSGNIVLKTIEGTAKVLIKDIYQEMNKAKNENDIETQKVLAKTIAKLMGKYDFNSLAGATLLGVDKVIVKGHGSANADTIQNIVKQAYVMIRNSYLGSIYNQ